MAGITNIGDGAEPSEIGGKRKIDPEILNQVRELYLSVFGQEVDVLGKITRQVIPDEDDKEFYKKVTFRGNALRTQMNVIKECARGITKEIQDYGNNTEESKRDTAKVLQLIEKRLAKDGLYPDEEITKADKAANKERGRRISEAKKKANAEREAKGKDGNGTK